MRVLRTWGVWILVLLGMLVGLAFAGSDHFRTGGYVLGAVLVGAAVVRLLSPSRWVASLIARSRGVDAAFLAVIGAGIVLLTKVARHTT